MTLAHAFSPSPKFCLTSPAFLSVQLKAFHMSQSKSASFFLSEHVSAPCNLSASIHCCSCPLFTAISTTISGRSIKKYPALSGRFIAQGRVSTQSVLNLFLTDEKCSTSVFKTRSKVLASLLTKYESPCSVDPSQPSTLRAVEIVLS